VAGAFVRQIDELGRVVIPAEIRARLDLSDGSPLDIFVEGESVILSAYRPGCLVCGNLEGVQVLRGRRICGRCAREAAALFGAAGPEPVATESAGPRDQRGRGDTGAAVSRTAEHLAARGWRVEGAPTSRAVDLVAHMQTRTWYLRVCGYEDEPLWPSGHELGWLKGAARRSRATAVIAFVRLAEPPGTIEFVSALTEKPIEA